MSDSSTEFLVNHAVCCRTEPEPKPEPTPEAKPDPAPVRCCDCTHWRGRLGWCPVARKPANSARAWRRCESFEPRAVQAQERPVEAPPLAPVPTQRVEPIERVRRRLVELGMLDHLALLVALKGGRVGVRLRRDLDDDATHETLVAIGLAIEHAA